MAFNLLGNAVKTVGNVVGDVVSAPDKLLIGNQGGEGPREIKVKQVTILGGEYMEEQVIYPHMYLHPTTFVIVGPVVYTFYKANGFSVAGDINVLDSEVQLAKQFLQDAEESGSTVVLSIDGKTYAVKVVPASEIPDGWKRGEEILPSTNDVIADVLKDVYDIKWNGYPIKGLYKKLGEAEDNDARVELVGMTENGFPKFNSSAGYD